MLFFTLVQMLPWMVVATYEEKSSVTIIGGSPIKIEEAPYMALFRPRGHGVFCGASIVAEQFLVTAAHCVIRNIKMTVTVGTDKAMSGGQIYQVREMVVHPKFGKSSPDYDIAVIKLEKKMNFSDRVRPIQLAEPGIVIEDGAKLRVIGFGRTSISGPTSNQLLSVEVPHVPVVNCSSVHGDITDQMICAGEKKKGGCMGDSGGPLVYGDKLVGSVSFGSAYCDEPTVFARISSMRDFIYKVINDKY